MNRRDGMLFDALNMFIIYSFWNAALEGRVTTTWEIAKNYYATKDEKNANQIYTRKSNVIRQRITTMVKEGIMDVSKEDGEDVYTLLADKNVWIMKVRFYDGKRRNAIILKRRDGKLITIEI